MEFDDILKILDDVPDYQVFLTVDELHASTRRLVEDNPEVVDILPLGESRSGDPIEALKIGNGPKTALLFAMPHPNEPIGSMMLEFLSARLVEDTALRELLGYTWYLIKCIDIDGTRLNEGWFKGPFSITHYARNFYRPPSYLQVEWTFPIEYKTLKFDDPLPETQALMKLLDEIRPDFIYSLHNSGFGGAYFYISEDAPSLTKPFHRLVESQDLPLHLGEPEMPYATQYAQAVFKAPPLSDTYDFFEQQTGKDPATVIKGGTSSFDYARRFGDPFSLVCEMPYFYNPAIHDTSPSDMIRREAILLSVENRKAHLTFMQEQMDALKDELTIASPFRDAIEEMLRTMGEQMAAHENWAKSDPKTANVATTAEKLDNLVIGRFYMLLALGEMVRMLDEQIAATGPSEALGNVRKTVLDAFESRSTELEHELDYQVIPIQKLVRVQLGSALLAAEYSAERDSSSL